MYGSAHIMSIDSDVAAAYHEAAHCIVASRLGLRALADDLLLERQLTGFALTRRIERAENQERRIYDHA